MTGAIFVLFFSAALLFLEPTLAIWWITKLTGDWPAAAAGLAIIGFPMIGITIQGAYFCLHTMALGHWFEDPARKYVAKKVRVAIEMCRKAKAQTDVGVDWKLLRKAPDDAFFVWLYHDRATPHMIEWARRRRSYYYLGWNWVIAALAGLFAALLIGKTNWTPETQVLGFLGFGMIWAGGAIWAAEQMRRDADTMEAIWAASQVDPGFRDCLSTLLPPETVESLPLHPAARKPRAEGHPGRVPPVHDEPRRTETRTP